MSLLFITGAVTVLFILASIPSKLVFNAVRLTPSTMPPPKVATTLSDATYKENECRSDTCRQSAKRIEKYLNRSVDPCDDFYLFACGNFKTLNPIPNDKSEVSHFTELGDLVNMQIQELLLNASEQNEPTAFSSLKNFYQICVRTDQGNRTDIDQVLKDLGVKTWPVDQDDDNTWEDVYYNIYNLGLVPKYLLSYNVDANYTDSTIKLLSLSGPESILDRESLIEGPTSDNVKHYYNAMRALSNYLNINGNKSDEMLKQVVEFEIQLAKAKKPLAELLDDLQASFNVLTLDELAMQHPQFPWMRFVKSLTTPNINVDGHLQLIITEPKFAARLIQLLQDTPAHVVKNYLIWRAVYDVAEYLNDDVRNIREMVRMNVEGSKERKERKTECLETIKTNFEVALSAIYVRRFSDENSKREATDLTKMMKNSFKSILNESTWTNEDIHIAFDKIDNIFQDIAYSEELLNDNKINEYYNKLMPIETTDTLLKSSLKVNAFMRDMPFLEFQLPVDHRAWYEQRFATVINAYYNVITNSIVIPAAILQSTSLFNASSPKYSNYAALGYIVAHEITHGFDNIGRQITKDGNLKNWLSNATQAEFDKRIKCITEQYDKYTTVDNVHINGALTSRENIADFGGLKTAYRAYSNLHLNEDNFGLNLNNKQLFWVRFAQVWCHNAKDEYLKYTAQTNSHPTNQIRVNGVLRNTIEFSADYNCPLESSMNPRNKCMPW